MVPGRMEAQAGRFRISESSGGSGIRVQGSGFRVQGSGLRCEVCTLGNASQKLYRPPILLSSMTSEPVARRAATTNLITWYSHHQY
eukprot:1229094-Rhodomonas_salina.3